MENHPATSLLNSYHNTIAIGGRCKQEIYYALKEEQGLIFTLQQSTVLLKPNRIQIPSQLLLKMASSTPLTVEELQRRLAEASFDENDPAPVVILSNVTLNQSLEAWKYTLIGKIFHLDTHLTPHEVYRSANTIWWRHGEVQTKRIEDDIYTFSFKTERAMCKVLNEAPWCICDNLVILTEWNPRHNINDYQFTHQMFWVQLKKLPVVFHNREVPIVLGSLIGEVRELKPENGSPHSGPVKILVNIDVEKPLIRGVQVADANGEPQWVRFYFEVQPKNICQKCFVIKHDVEHCEETARKLTKMARMIYSFGSPLPQYNDPPLSRPHRQLCIGNTVHIGTAGSSVLAHSPGKRVKRAREGESSSNYGNEDTSVQGASNCVSTPNLPSTGSNTLISEDNSVNAEQANQVNFMQGGQDGSGVYPQNLENV